MKFLFLSLALFGSTGCGAPIIQVPKQYGPSPRPTPGIAIAPLPQNNHVLPTNQPHNYHTSNVSPKAVINYHEIYNTYNYYKCGGTNVSK